MSSTPSHKNIDKPYFPNLYGLRFLAALSVFVFHGFTLFRENWGDVSDSFWYNFLNKFISKGTLGVNLFFVLSGFLITYLLLWELKTAGKINVLQFLKRRTLRIWPVYFLVICFGFFIFPFLPFGESLVYDLKYHLTFLSNFNEISTGAKDSLNFMTPPWSVSVEEQFYVAFSIFILIIGTKLKKLLPVLFTGIILISLVFRFLHVNDERTMYFHSLSVIGDLAVGGWIAYLAFQNKIQSVFTDLSKFKIVFIYLIGLGIILGKTMIFKSYFHIFERLILALFFGFVILEQIYAKHSFIKLDQFKVLKIGGEISYGFYMYHCILFYFSSHILTECLHLNNLTGFLIHLSLLLPLNYFLSYLSFKYFESFFLKFK